MEQQIAAAVQAAVVYDPSKPSLQAEAYKFLSEVKDGCTQTWQACLGIFLAGQAAPAEPGGWRYSFAPEARMYGLQVVDDVLGPRFDALSQDQVVAIQAGLVDYVKREYTTGNAEGQLLYLRNKVVHTLFLLFMQTYTSTSQDFFQSFFQLLPATNSSTEQYNAKAADLMLRLLHELSTEISDTTLRLNKAHARLLRDTELRDAVRGKDAAGIADHVIRLLAFALQRIDQPSSSLTSPRAVELAEMSLRVLADYASWIDIALLVTPTFLPILFQCLAITHTSIRIASAELVYELISKGMPPADKLELIRVLNVSEIITQLLSADDASRNTTSNGHSGGDDQAELFKEKLARLLNVLGSELTKIVDEASATDAQRETALASALTLRPLTLRFLDDEYDDTSATVIPFLQNLFSIYKREKKRNAQGHLTADKAEFLRSVMATVFRKMRYSREEEWGGEDDDEDGEDEDVAAFTEYRRQLKTVFDAVAWIDFDLFSSACRNLIFTMLDAVDAGGQGQTWSDVEVTLYVLYIYGEPAAKETGTSGIAAFVKVPKEELTKQKRQLEYRINYSAFGPSVLGELMLRVVQSKISSWPHPSVPLQLFECVSRYHDFFQLMPETITTILPAFLDERGMHQEKQSIRSRCFYLFNRFVHTARVQLQQHLPPQAVTDVCTRVEDLLAIEVSLSPPDTPSEDPLTKAASRGSPFDSQLYLFEALGTLISLLNKLPEQQVALLQALLQPLLRDIQNAADPSVNSTEALLRLHHLIRAVGNIAYGFPEVKNAVNTVPEGQWVPVVIEAMRVILVTLKAKNSVPVIREASLGAFKSVAARTTIAALPLVVPLIDCLVDQLTVPEIIEFLPFLGMLTHRYKSAFVDILDQLLGPVFDRTYLFLEQPVTGTDDIQQHSELRRAYFGLLHSICTAGMQDIFFSAQNLPRLETLLSSIPHYIDVGGLLLDQKTGLAVINRLVQEWVKPKRASESSRLPQFKDFVYERVVRLGMELPVRQAFDYSDAQAYNVIGEVATLYKTLETLRGQEFLSYLTTNVFPSFNIPEQVAKDFVERLTQASDGRAFKKYLAPFFQKAKQSSDQKPYSVAHLLTAVPSAAQ